MIKTLIFDFDGVIAESNNVKTDAFVKLFDEYPHEYKERIKVFHLQNGGMSRFDKFRYIYANVLKEPLSDDKFNKLCADFKRLVVDGVINAPLVDGIRDFLVRNKKRYDMYLVSATPQDEIEMIVNRRGLGKYFLGIYGSPRLKKDLIEEILRNGNYKRNEIVFLGDSINDYEGARDAGVQFVAKIFNDAKMDLFPNADIKVKIREIAEFEKYLSYSSDGRL